MKHLIRAGLALAIASGVAAAQNPPAAQPKAQQPKVQAAQPGQPAVPGQPGMGRMGMMGGQPDRAALEQQIRNRIGTQLKKNLNLTDDQFTKLQATNKKFEEKRRLLNEQERDARMAVRDLMISGDTTNAGKVSAALDKVLGVQRQRFDLMEQEQKELAGYLSPMQRVRFLGMQEGMRRRIESMRQQGPGGPGGMGPGMGQGMGQGMGPGGAPGAMQPGAMRNGQRPLRQGLRGPNGPPPGAQQPPVPPMDEFEPR